MRFRDVELIKTIFNPKEVDDPGYPQFAIAGRSNTGKSSLINTLFGRSKLARISRTPGRTRSINYYLVENRFIVADLPGYGFAKVSMRERLSWKNLVESYFKSLKKIKAVFLLIDSKRSIEEEERILLDFLSSLDVKAIVVFTKVDRLTQKERALLAKRCTKSVIDLTGDDPILFSAKTGEGKSEIIRSIRDLL